MALYGNMQIPAKGAAGGGALPTRQAPESGYVVGQSQSARLSAAGGAAAAASEEANARALGSLAQGIDRFGKLGLEIHRKDEEIDLARAQGAYAKLQEEGIAERARLEKLQGAGAIGADGTPDAEAQWNAWFNKAKTRYAQGLGERGLWYFNQHAGTYGANGAAWASGHVQRELGRFQDQQLALAIDAEGRSIGADPFSSAAEASLGRVDALIDQKAARLGWTPEMAAQAKQSAHGKAWSNAISVQLSMGNINGAQALMQAHGAELSPDDIAKATQAYNQQVMSLAAGMQAAGDVDGLAGLAGADGDGGNLNAGVFQAASKLVGAPYIMDGVHDCGGRARQIAKAAVPGIARLFNGTAAEQFKSLSSAAGGAYEGEAQVKANLRGGIVLFSSGQSHAKGRPGGVGHEGWLVQEKDGHFYVYEGLNKKAGFVKTPIEKWLAREKGQGHTVYSVDVTRIPGAGGKLALSQANALHLQGMQAPARANAIADAAAKGGGTVQEIETRANEMLMQLPPGVRDKVSPHLKKRLAELEDADKLQKYEDFQKALPQFDAMDPRQQEEYILRAEASGAYSAAQIKQLKDRQKLARHENEKLYEQELPRMDAKGQRDALKEGRGMVPEDYRKEKLRELDKAEKDAERAAAKKEKAAKEEAKEKAKKERRRFLTIYYGRADEAWSSEGRWSGRLEKDIKAAAVDGTITHEDAAKLIEYGRSGGCRKLFRGNGLKDAYNDVMGYTGTDRVEPPAALAMQAWEYFKDHTINGKIVSPEELRNFCAEWTRNVDSVTEIEPDLDNDFFPGWRIERTKETMPAWKAKAEGKTITGVEPPVTAIPRLKEKMKKRGMDPENEEELRKAYALELGGKL